MVNKTVNAKRIFYDHCADCGQKKGHTYSPRCHLCANRKTHNDPEFQRKNRAAMKKLTSSPEWKRKIRAHLKRLRNDPEYQRKNRAHLKRLRNDPEYQRKNRAQLKRLRNDPEWQRNNRAQMKKLTSSPEWKRKNRAAMKKLTSSPEWKRKIRAHLKRLRNDPEYQRNHCAAMKKMSGPNSPAWQGGISFEPYSPDFCATLKRYIRERDHHRCQICGVKENGKHHDIHHIDYNKKNCRPENLILLCQKHHGQTNQDRPRWQAYFTKMMIMKEQPK